MMFALPIALYAQVIVETGVARGHSTELFLNALQYTGGHLWSYDIKFYQDTYNKLRKKGLTDRWTYHVLNSVEGAEKWKDPPIDLLYLDSNHACNYVKREMEAWTPHLRKDGLMMVHDLTPDRDVPFERSMKGILMFLEDHPDWNFVTLLGSQGMGLLWRK